MEFTVAVAITCPTGFLLPMTGCTLMASMMVQLGTLPVSLMVIVIILVGLLTIPRFIHGRAMVSIRLVVRTMTP